MTGMITKVFGRYYTISTDEGDIIAVLRGRLRKDKRLKRYSDPAAVGDMVEYTLGDDGSGVIEEVLERRNVFTRKDRGRRGEDLIGANLDQILVIQSFHEPRLNLRFVDRILVRGEKEGIPVALCVNKSDLALRGEASEIKDYYRDSGLEIITVSALKRKGLDKLKQITFGKRSILVGYSGVGKSSLLNSIYPGLDLKTSEVSDSTGKGRHTTTNVELVRINETTAVIDTPGVREFGLMDIEPPELADYFREFSYAESCQFRPCTHDHEPGCGVKELVEEGKISEGRYISYLNILYSLKEYYDNLY